MTEQYDNILSAWQARFGAWEGSIHDLADLAARLQGEIFTGEAQETLANVRLIRHYLAIGLMTRGERRGKEAVFGLRQLLEYLAARALLRDGWPLAKIGLFTSTSSDVELAGLLPVPAPSAASSAPRSRNRAQELVARFRVERAAGGVRSAPSDPERRRLATASDSPARRVTPADPTTGDYVATRFASHARNRLLLESGSASAFEHRARPVRIRRTLTIELAPWCQLMMDEAGLDTLDEKTLVALVERLRRALRTARRNQGDDDGTA